MPFSSIPTTWYDVGKPGKQELFDLIKDNQDYLYGNIAALQGANISNGSFEVDSDSDGIPDLWTPVYYPGGSGAIETTSPAHGAQAWKFVHPGGSGNGGGYIDSDYIEVTSLSTYLLGFIHWASAAGMKNQVIVRYFDSSKAYLSDITLYSSTSNPTSATLFRLYFTPPSTARYAKVRLVGGLNDTDVAGSAYFDMVQFCDPTRKEIFTSNGSFVVPGGQEYIYAVCVGAGGGGGGGSAVNQERASGGGGGGGGVIEGWINVVGLETLTISVGAGGAGGPCYGSSGGAGGDGGVSKIVDSGAVTLLEVAGGAGGGPGSVGGNVGGAGGAGGAATSGFESWVLKTTNGADGTYSATALDQYGGDAGAATPYRGSAAGGTSGTAWVGQDGTGHGCGGGGGGCAASSPYGQAGGTGSGGLVLIMW